MKIAFFGPGTGHPGEPNYDSMRECGRLLAQYGHIVLTGGHVGGAGTEAPACGASDAGGRAIALTYAGSDGNRPWANIVSCDEAGEEKLDPEEAYGLHIGRLMLADGFIFDASGGIGTFAALTTILTTAMKFWPKVGKVKRIALLKPDTVPMNRWTVMAFALADEVHEDLKDVLRICGTALEAVSWVETGT